MTKKSETEEPAADGPNWLPRLVRPYDADTVHFEISSKASEQGWAIFEASGDPDAVVGGKPYGIRPYELQKDDEAGVFRDDLEAWSFVARQAERGDETAQRAIEFLRDNSPNEYGAFIIETGLSEIPFNLPNVEWRHANQ